jgi:hypothetical protein
MASSETKHERIQKACIELEMALQNFESHIGLDTADAAVAQNQLPIDVPLITPANDRVNELKNMLAEIRTQLDNLST